MLIGTARPMLPLMAWALLLASCAASTRSEAAPMTDQLSVTSPSFSDGATIPARHTCDGDDVSPPIEWSGAPEGTAAYALIVDDPDARGFVHWVVADLPAETTSLAEGGSDGVQGRNDFGRSGYGGPCPPSGSHRYVFTVYALSERTGAASDVSADDLRAAMEGKVLGSGQLAASYRRGG